MPKVSIIVPVYKVEQYIRECLDSIKVQTFKDWECLLIDDGSPDNSGKICDEYALIDSRFKVFHIENGGVSHARNIGLDNMSGEWVMFVDSDDVIAVKTLEVCLNKVESNNLDILQFSFARDKEDFGATKDEPDVVMQLEDYVKARKCLVCVGGCLLHATIIKENNIRFDPILKLAEDQLFIYQYMNNSTSLMRINDKLYWYRLNENSASRNQKTNDIKNSIIELVKFRDSTNVWRSIIDKVLIYFIIDIIINNDMDIHSLIALVKYSNIKDMSLSTGSSRVFYILNKFNTRIAILFIKYKYCKR